MKLHRRPEPEEPGPRHLQVQKRRKQASTYRQKELGYNPKDARLLLTTEDLTQALKEVRSGWRHSGPVSQCGPMHVDHRAMKESGCSAIPSVKGW